MLRRVLAISLSAAVTLYCAPARAQTTPTIPGTPAGTVLREWLDAFNSADTARLDAYFRRYEPNKSARAEMPFREQVGGFDLVTVERSEPRRVEFVAKERKGARTAYGIIELSDAEPRRVTSFPLWPLGENGTASAVKIDAATRSRVIDSAVAKLDEIYVFPAVAKQMGDSLRARLKRGAYDGEANGIAFAHRLHNELREISKDKHLRVDYRVAAIPPRPAAPPPPTPEQRARQQQQMDEANCGFEKAERLEGNVGYLKFNFFANPELCGATADAAMQFLAGTRALIVDMRENTGGSPAMVSYVSSHLFATRTHLNDLWDRRTGRTQEYWTRDSVPGRRFGGEKPIYVLTSSRTFSGGEEFTYNLKSLKRATIVGERTGGGAHPVSGYRLDEHFMMGVPGARAINPITRTNWEGVGVEPDVKVPAAEALATALKLIRQPTRQ